jgi:uncharacterized protein
MNRSHDCCTFSLIALVMLSSMLHGAEPQGTQSSPGIPCANAATAAEKLICSDRDLVALDLEYSRVVAARL